MKRNELFRDRARPILDAFTESVMKLFEGQVDEIEASAQVAAVERVRAAFLGEDLTADSDPLPPPRKRKRRKTKGVTPAKPRSSAVQPEAVLADRDIKPAKSAPKGMTCSKCGTPGHNARTCRGGRGGGVELGEADRPTTDHDRRELIAAHQQRLAAERAAKEKQKRDAWLEQSDAAA